MRTVSRLIALLCPILMLSGAVAAPQRALLEDRYIAARDAAIEKISQLYDAGKSDDSAQKAEEAARSELQAEMSSILAEPNRGGFAQAKLNLDTFYKGDQGFGMLDGLRFDAETGKTGAKAGGNGADGKYVEPRAHVIVTTERLFAHWLRAHKDWWGKGVKNVPQQIGSALRAESFYTQAISTDAAVISFNALPIARPANATFVYGFLAGRTQSEIPDAADEVFVSAQANGKVYVAYGSIEPAVRIPACTALRAGYDPQSEALRQQGEDAFRRCFTERAPRQTSFANAIKQAQALLEAAIGR